MNQVFVGQPSNPKGCESNPPGPPRPPRYFGLLMVNQGRPPLPPNKPYRQPLNYLEYVKDFDLNAHVKVYKATIKANDETKDAKFVNMSSFTLKDIVFD
jgi:hypothetical protein